MIQRADGRKGVDIVLRLNTLGQRVETSSTTSTTTVVTADSSDDADDAKQPTALPVPAPVAPPPAALPSSDARITITLNEIPLGEALRYIASQAGLKVKVEPYAISIIPLSEHEQRLADETISGAAGIYQWLAERRALPLKPAGPRKTAKRRSEPPKIPRNRPADGCW